MGLSQKGLSVWVQNRLDLCLKEQQVKKKEVNGGSQVNKQTIYMYTAPKSTTESRAHHVPEPAWGG